MRLGVTGIFDPIPCMSRCSGRQQTEKRQRSVSDVWTDQERQLITVLSPCASDNCAHTESLTAPSVNSCYSAWKPKLVRMFYSPQLAELAGYCFQVQGLKMNNDAVTCGRNIYTVYGSRYSHASFVKPWLCLLCSLPIHLLHKLFTERQGDQ